MTEKIERTIPNWTFFGVQDNDPNEVAMTAYYPTTMFCDVVSYDVYKFTDEGDDAGEFLIENSVELLDMDTTGAPN